MSLINRMLRDLSSRQPGPGDVMGGIQLPPEEARPRASMLARLGMLAVLVVTFTGLLWFVFGPRPVKMPRVRGLPAGATVAAAPAPAAAPETPAEPTVTAPQEAAVAPEVTAAESPPAVAESEPPAEPEMSSPPAAEPPSPPAAPKAAPRPARKAPVRTASTGAATPAKAPAEPSAPSAEELYAKARRALERGDDAAAEAALVETLAAKPELHYAREDLGNLSVRQGRLDNAEAVLRAGYGRDPSFVGYRRLAARIELARDRPAAAVEVLLRDPPPVESDVGYHALLASAYQRLGRHEEASRGYAALARVQPDAASWWAGYGLSRDALDDSVGALAAYTRARQLGGLDPRVLQYIDQRTAALQAGGA